MFATNVTQLGSQVIVEFDVSEETFQTANRPQLWLTENPKAAHGLEIKLRCTIQGQALPASNRLLRIACCTLGQEVLEMWGQYRLAALMAEYRLACRVYNSALTTVRRPWGQNTFGYVQRVWKNERLVLKSCKAYRNGEKVQAIGEYDADDVIQYAVFLTGCREPGWYNPEAGEGRIAPQLVTRMHWTNTPHIVLPESSVLYLRELMK